MLNVDDSEDALIPEKKEIRKKEKKRISRGSTADLNRSLSQLKKAMKEIDESSLSLLIVRFVNILNFQVLLTFLIAMLISYQFSSIKAFISLHQGIYVIIFIITALLCMSSFIKKHHLRYKPYNIICLSIFTFGFIYILTFMCVTTNEQVFLMSIFMTFVVSIALTIYLLTNEFSLTGCSICVIFIGILYYYFFTVQSNFQHVLIVISLIWLLLWGFYLIFWLWYLKKKSNKLIEDDYILISFKFYMCVLFLLSVVYAFRKQEVDFLEDFNV